MNRDEKILIKRIKQLKKIKPDRDWVFSVKHEIMGTRFSPFFVFKPLPVVSFAFLLTVFVLKTFFALPGERLYFVKKNIQHLASTFFVSKEEPTVVLNIVDEKLRELEKASLENRVKQLPQTLKEYQSVSQETAKIIREKKLDEKTLSLQKPILKDIVARQQNIKASLNSPEAELKDFNCALFEKLSADLKERTLTEKQKEILNEAQKDFENKNCLDALTKVLYLDNN